MTAESASPRHDEMCQPRGFADGVGAGFLSGAWNLVTLRAMDARRVAPETCDPRSLRPIGRVSAIVVERKKHACRAPGGGREARRRPRIMPSRSSRFAHRAHWSQPWWECHYLRGSA